MAICQECERDMLTASSCTVSALHVRGVALPLVPYGRDGAAGPARRARCADCGVQLGGFHHLGCDMARCPRCRRQLLSCGCPFDEFDDGHDGDDADEDEDELLDGDEWDDDGVADQPPPLCLAEENACPSCGSTSVIPILYGSPNPAMASLSRQGLVELAGSVFDRDQPSSRCRDCDHSWSRRAG